MTPIQCKSRGQARFRNENFTIARGWSSQGDKRSEWYVEQDEY